MPGTTSTSVDALVLVDDANGITVIPQLSELRRLNWFDGKLLRADDLRVEQDHVRGLVRRANRAGGRGVVDGFTVTLGGDGRLHVGPGTAVDPSGRSLLLPVDVALDLRELIAKTAGTSPAAAPAAKPVRVGRPQAATPARVGRPDPPVRVGRPDPVRVGRPDLPKRVGRPQAAAASFNPAAIARGALALAGITAAGGGFADCEEPEVAGQVPVGGGRWYVISVGWAEGLCGNEEVYGRLCEDACATSTDRPWRMDGLVFRARPITPRAALATSAAAALDARHERSLLASALFADEDDDGGSLIFGAGLRSGVWCTGAAAAAAGRDEVALAVVGRAGDTTTFLDMWTARRERMQPPPQRYWAGRMSMRPWDVFLAQVLQFQCQLSDLLDGGPAPSRPGAPDPCAERQRVLEAAIAELEKRPLAAEESGEDPALELLRQQVLRLRLPSRPGGARRILIDGGIVELPPAGYLPVNPAGPPDVEGQARALLGDGVALTFCTSRADAVARALEEAQHLDRISLLTGLDDPKRREAVEIIVPDAEILGVVARDAWLGRLRIATGAAQASRRPPALDGAGRVQTRDALALHWAGAAPSTQQGASTAAAAPSAFLEASADRDPFSLNEGETVSFSAAGDTLLGGRDDGVTRGSLHGRFRLQAVEQRPGGALLRGVIDAVANWRTAQGDGQEDGGTLNLDRAPATLLRRPGDDGGTQLLLRVSVRKTILTASLTYHGDADSVELAAFLARGASSKATTVANRAAAGISLAGVVVAPGFGEELARLSLDREPGAASPASPARLAAEGALRELQRALGDPGYAQDSGRRLFPGDGDGGLRLRATRDWVLFRRRAQLRCGGEVEAPTQTDRFAVYGLVADDATEQRTYGHLGEVRFARGSAALGGGSDAVAGAWDDVADGGRLVAAGVVSGSPGGDELGLRRVSALVGALSGVTKPDGDLTPKVLEPDDLELDDLGADGILVVTAAPAPSEPVATFTAAVFAVSSELVDAYKRDMVAGNFAAGVKRAFDGETALGTIDFEGDSAAPAKPEEVQAVADKYQSSPSPFAQRVDAITVKDDPDGGSENTRLERAGVVSKAIGAGDDGQQFAVTKTAFAGTKVAPATTILLILPATPG